MVERVNARRYLWVLVVIVALFVSTVGVTALAQTDEGDVFTGCVNEESGALKNVAIGFDPAKPCNPQESQITWDRAGPAFEERIAALEEQVAALEEQVAALEEPYGTLELFVDCATGDTVGNALTAAQTHPGPVDIAISGVCDENVQIRRDDVNIHGQQRSDGIRAASPAESAVDVRNARGVTFGNMTISGGSAGISTEGSAHFQAQELTVRDTTTWGIWVVAGASVLLVDCDIVDNASFGVTADAGTARIIGTEISGNQWGLHATVAGSIQGFDLTVTGNQTGVTATSGGAIDLSGSSIEGNTDWGVAEWHGGSVNVGGDSRIANSGKNGVLVGFNSVFNVSETVIESNGNGGIHANGSSTVEVGANVTIRNNANDGINLRDSSYGFANQFASVQIVDNGGWGINCAGPATVKEAQNGFNMSSIVLSGNTDGDTNCP